MTYALDTNIVIHYLRNTPAVLDKINAATKRGDSLIVPQVVDYEIRRGFSIQRSPKKEHAYGVLTEESTGICNIPPMDDESWKRAEQVYAELYKNRFTSGEMDMLIAAFCLANDCTLVTNNTKDFENIDGLSLTDWTKIE